jgi:hypothetical protein
MHSSADFMMMRGGNGQKGRETPTGCLRGKLKARGHFGHRGLNGKMIVKYV